MTEQFKDIQGYEGLYQISNTGKVYSTPVDGKPAKLLKLELIKASNTTYNRVALSKNGKVQRFQVHRLVAQAFIPNPDNYPIVNHLDSNGSNNYVTNLEWCTQKHNIQHGILHGNILESRKIIGEVTKQRTISKVSMEFSAFFHVPYTVYHDGKDVRIETTCSCGALIDRRASSFRAVGNPYCKGCTYKHNAVKKVGHTNSPTKPVARYTLDGTFVAKYPSIAAAKKATNDNNISNVLAGRHKQSLGHTWKYL